MMGSMLSFVTLSEAKGLVVAGGHREPSQGLPRPGFFAAAQNDTGCLPLTLRARLRRELVEG
jgi:hypothetical protein